LALAGALDRGSGGSLMSAFSLLLALFDRGLRVGFFIVGADGVGGWF
jgi:hypothetical protein